MSVTVFVPTCDSVFDVCAIIGFYLRVLCVPLPLSRLTSAAAVATVISSPIPFTLVHYTLNQLLATSQLGTFYGLPCVLISVFTDGRLPATAFGIPISYGRRDKAIIISI